MSEIVAIGRLITKVQPLVVLEKRYKSYEKVTMDNSNSSCGSAHEQLFGDV